MGQVTARISDELEAALTQWAAEEGLSRPDLIRNILSEAAGARDEGRVMFAKPELPRPADLQRLTTQASDLLVELDRVLRHNAKRDAELVRDAKADAVGVSKARTAIIGRMTDELQRLKDDMRAELGQLPGLAALQTGLARVGHGFQESLGALSKQAEDRHDTLLDQVKATQAMVREARLSPNVKSLHLHFGKLPWDMRLLGLFGLAAFGLLEFAALSSLLPQRIVALPVANRILGGGDHGICNLVRYTYDTDPLNCSATAKDGKVTLVAALSKPGRR